MIKTRNATGNIKPVRKLIPGTSSLSPSVPVNSSQVFSVTDEFEKATGKSSEDWTALVGWIQETKGLAFRNGFENRLGYPL